MRLPLGRTMRTWLCYFGSFFFLPKPLLLSWLTRFFSYSRHHVPGLLLRCSSPTRSSQQPLQQELEVGREWGKKERGKARAFLCSVLFTQVKLWCSVNCTLLGDFFHYVPPQFWKALQHFFPLYILVSPLGCRKLVCWYHRSNNLHNLECIFQLIRLTLDDGLGPNFL
jgi:hypothetical protein